MNERYILPEMNTVRTQLAVKSYETCHLGPIEFEGVLGPKLGYCDNMA